MGRIYRVQFENVSVSAPQDLVQITGAAGKLMKIRRAKWGATNTTAPTNQQISTRCRLLPSTVTVGSGGTTGITPSKNDPGDAACSSSTCATNNTAKATTNGTATILEEDGSNVYAGYDHAWPEKSQPVVGPSQAFVFELLSTPTGTVNMSGLVEIEEIGG